MAKRAMGLQPGEGRGAGQDLRLVLPAVVVWAGMWLITGWNWGVWAVGGASAAGLVAVSVTVIRRFPLSSGRIPLSSGRIPLSSCRRQDLTRQQRARLLWLTVATVMAASCVLVGGLRVAGLEHGRLAEAAQTRATVLVQVQVRTSHLSASWGMAVVEADCRKVRIGPETLGMSQPVVLLVPAQYAQEWLSYQSGTLVQLRARLAPSQIGDGTAAVLSPVAAPQVIRPPPLWQRIIESMRTGLVAAVRGNPPQQAALVPGLVVGDVSAMTPDMVSDFKTTALTHLTAVSGANLAILLSFLTVVARWAGVRGRWLTVVSVVGIALFVVLCHSEPSVVRAAAMGVVSLAALGRGGGQGSGVRGLSLAVIGLCWFDPWMSRSVGFVLSVLACGGIIAWGRRWTSVLSRWLPTPVAEAMAIPLAAQVATQPVICWLSGAVSVSGLAANAAAGPWVGPATVIGLVAALISPISPAAASWAGYVAGWCAQPILTVSHALAALPGASHPWPANAVGLITVTLACLVVARVMPLVLSRIWAVLTATALLVATMLVAPYQPGWPGQRWEIAACDVGQGDAVAVHVADSQAVLVDAGPDGQAVVACLNQLGVRSIPLLVLTHFHADHAGAFADVVNAFRVKSLLVPAGGGDGSAVLKLAAELGIGVSVATTGMTVTIADTTVTVVSAWQGTTYADSAEESAAENNESIILRVDTPGMSLLDTGDVEPDGQRAALRNPGQVRVDVLKVPHHGSRSQDADFLKATGARIALLSVGLGNPYRHPADWTVKQLVNNGMEVVRTDEHGSIAVSRDPDWSITTQK